MKTVEIVDLSFKYSGGEKKTLNNINMVFNSGEITGLSGPSGCGKSTLCNCITRLVPRVYTGDLTGNIYIKGVDINTMSHGEIVSQVGIIFQNPSTQLFSPTIEDELAFGAENLCVEPKEILERIDYMLELLNMEDYRYEDPNNLSGGQQQLVAIASVLTMNPEIIICDEIMTWIDEDGKEIIRELLLKLKEDGKTIIMIDHEKENLSIVDKIIYM